MATQKNTRGLLALIVLVIVGSAIGYFLYQKSSADTVMLGYGGTTGGYGGYGYGGTGYGGGGTGYGGTCIINNAPTVSGYGYGGTYQGTPDAYASYKSYFKDTSSTSSNPLYKLAVYLNDSCNHLVTNTSYQVEFQVWQTANYNDVISKPPTIVSSATTYSKGYADIYLPVIAGQKYYFKAFVYVPVVNKLAIMKNYFSSSTGYGFSYGETLEFTVPKDTPPPPPPSAVSVSVKYPYGWSMATSPFIGDNQSPGNAFGDFPAAIWSWDGSTYQQKTTVDNKNGYWIFMQSAVNKTLYGPGETAGKVTTPLAANSWKMINNPYPYPINNFYGMVVKENGVYTPIANSSFPYVYRYNASTNSYDVYVASRENVNITIKPGEAFWYYAPSTMTEFVVNNPLTAIAEPQVGAPTNPATPISRSIQPNVPPPPAPPISPLKSTVSVSGMSITPSSIARGKKVKVVYTITNITSETIPSVSTTIMSNGTLLGSPKLFSNLKAGESKQVTYSITVSPKTKPGTYIVVASATQSGGEESLPGTTQTTVNVK